MDFPKQFGIATLIALVAAGTAKVFDIVGTRFHILAEEDDVGDPMYRSSETPKSAPFDQEALLRRYRRQSFAISGEDLEEEEEAEDDPADAGDGDGGEEETEGEDEEGQGDEGDQGGSDVPPSFPALSNAVAWAKSDGVPDEAVSDYLVQVAGTNGRARKRETMIERVEAYVAAQSAD